MYLKDLSETAGMLTKAYIQMVHEIKAHYHMYINLHSLLIPSLHTSFVATAGNQLGKISILYLMKTISIFTVHTCCKLSAAKTVQCIQQAPWASD